MACLVCQQQITVIMTSISYLEFRNSLFLKTIDRGTNSRRPLKSPIPETAFIDIDIDAL
jgi:hypothetical protein